MQFILIQIQLVFNCIFQLYAIDDEGGEEDDTPKPEWKPPPVIPKEENRTGTNKRTFFVTTDRTYSIAYFFNV